MTNSDVCTPTLGYLYFNMAHLTLYAYIKNYATSQLFVYMKTIHAFQKAGQMHHSQKSSKHSSCLNTALLSLRWKKYYAK